MATRDAAGILGWEQALGSIEPGKLADLLVVDGTGGDPYATLLTADETAIRLVLIDGVARYGHPGLLGRLGAAGAPVETIRVGGRTRALHLHQTTADPAIGAISLAAARRRLADALATLPDLARELEASAVAPGHLALGPEPLAWFLALDELGQTGMELRPRLPLPSTGEPTGPSLDAALAAAPLSTIVTPLRLDPLTVADDGEFVEAMAQQPNLPPFIRSALKDLYS
jgi:hypothetical protein